MSLSPSQQRGQKRPRSEGKEELEAEEEEKASPAQPSAAASATPAAASSSLHLAEELAYDTDSSSGSHESTELVVVSLPATLVQQLRARSAADGGRRSIELLDLASSRPHFKAPFDLPPIGTADSSSSLAHDRSSSPLTPAVMHTIESTFVGTYEYSVGTSLLWRISPDPLAVAAASAGLSLGRSLAAAGFGSSAVSGATPAASNDDDEAEAALRASSPAPRAAAGTPTVPTQAGPSIHLAGKTWKRLVFARHR